MIIHNGLFVNFVTASKSSNLQQQQKNSKRYNKHDKSPIKPCFRFNVFHVNSSDGERLQLATVWCPRQWPRQAGFEIERWSLSCRIYSTRHARCTSWWSLLLIYRPREDERLSWPCWLTCCGRFTHINGYPSAAGPVQTSESSPIRDQRSTTEPPDQLLSQVSRN